MRSSFAKLQENCLNIFRENADKVQNCAFLGQSRAKMTHLERFNQNGVNTAMRYSDEEFIRQITGKLSEQISRKCRQSPKLGIFGPKSGRNDPLRTIQSEWRSHCNEMY